VIALYASKTSTPTEPQSPGNDQVRSWTESRQSAEPNAVIRVLKRDGWKYATAGLVLLSIVLAVQKGRKAI
jgi:hypothetical protein